MDAFEHNESATDPAAGRTRVNRAAMPRDLLGSTFDQTITRDQYHARRLAAMRHASRVTRVTR